MGKEGGHSNTIQLYHSDVLKDFIFSKASFVVVHHKPAHLTGAKAEMISA